MILALEILREVSYLEYISNSRVGVPMSQFRHHFNVPNASFFRHMNVLIKMQFVERVSRDRYRIHENNYNKIMFSKLDCMTEVETDFDFLS